MLESIKLTYQPRCCSSIFTSFEKLIDVNLFIDMYFFIFVIQINPTCGTYVLQSLQGHFLVTHFLSFAPEVLSVLEPFTSFGKISQIYGAKSETNSVP